MNSLKEWRASKWNREKTKKPLIHDICVFHLFSVNAARIQNKDFASIVFHHLFCTFIPQEININVATSAPPPQAYSKETMGIESYLINHFCNHIKYWQTYTQMPKKIQRPNIATHTPKWWHFPDFPLCYVIGPQQPVILCGSRASTSWDKKPTSLASWQPSSQSCSTPVPAYAETWLMWLRPEN